MKIVEDFINQLNNSSVAYVHFKSSQHLDKSARGETDFDLLVSKEGAAEFHQILLNLNFKEFYSSRTNFYPGVEDWIGFDNKSGNLIHLHIHYQLISGKAGYKHIVLPWNNIALCYACKDKLTGLFIVHPAFELIELYSRIFIKCSFKNYVKGIFNKFTLKEEHILEADYLRKQIDRKSLDIFFEKCYKCKLPGEFAELFFKNRLTAKEFWNFNKFITQKLKIYTRPGMRFIYIKSSLYLLLQKISIYLKNFYPLNKKITRKIPSTGGMMIAFLGCDGSGKTTVSNEISRWLSWKAEVINYSLGIGKLKNNFLAKIKRRFSNSTITHQNKNIITSEKHAKAKTSIKLLRLQYFYLNFARKTRKDIIQLYSQKMNGKIIVLDRYPQLMYSGLSDGPKVDPQFTNLHSKEKRNLEIINEIQPDLIFKLKVPLEVATKRRPYDDKTVLEKKINIIDNVKYKKSRIYTIDASQDLEDEIIAIKRIIWNSL